MTTVDNDLGQAVARLLALSPEDFRSLVEDSMGNGRPDLWEALLHPDVVRRTHTTLKSTHQDVLGQLAQKRAAEAEGGTDGEDPDWRRRALGYLRFVNRRLADAKYGMSTATPTPPQVAMEPGKRVRLMQTIFELGRAIREHQQQCDDLGITPEQHDLDLWDALDTVEVQTTDGLLPVGHVVDDILSRQGEES